MTRLWHSQAHMATAKSNEIVVDRGEGAYIWTEQGQRLLDVPASLWYCNVGHGRREIADAVTKQMMRLEAYQTFQNWATRPALDLADRIADLAPVPAAKVFLGSGGSDGIETAAKLARRYWGVVGRPKKTTVLARSGGYHGLHAFGTSLAGQDFNRDGYGVLVPGVGRVDPHDPDDLRRTIEQLGPENVGAFLCEPVIGSGGVQFPRPGYLRAVRDICTAYEVLFVLDEVITGFGRTGAMFGADRFGVTPDMLVFAKGVSSGYLPVGGVVISGFIAEPFWADDATAVFHHGLTYSGHATACAAALANIDILEQEGLLARVRELEQVLGRALAPLSEHPGVVEVRTGEGLLAGVQLASAELNAAVCAFCIDRGVLMRSLPGATLHISPPFVIESSEIQHMASTIQEGLDAAWNASTANTAAAR